LNANSDPEQLAVLRAAAPAPEAAAAYQQWLADWFTTDAAKLSQFYRDLHVAGF
jgi:hypothetical protein